MFRLGDLYGERDSLGGAVVRCVACGGGLGSDDPEKLVDTYACCSKECVEEALKENLLSPVPPIPKGWHRIYGKVAAGPGDLYGNVERRRWFRVDSRDFGRPAETFPVIVRHTTLTLISGGQTGADLAGLVAGRVMGLQTGGEAPKGWKTEKGTQPILAEYGLTESESDNYNVRTQANAANSDATIIFAHKPNSPGSRNTVKFAEAAEKPYLVLDPRDAAAVTKVRTFIEREEPRILNIAGNRESKAPGICKETVAVLSKALSPLPQYLLKPITP